MLIVLLVVLVPVSVIMIQSELHATGNTITVNTTDDPGTPTECSLRAAINNANNKTSDANSTCAAGTGQDTINFSVSGEITLGSTLPAIANTSPGNLTIDATGQGITINGLNSAIDSSVQLLVVNAGATLNLKYLTLERWQRRRLRRRNREQRHARSQQLQHHSEHRAQQHERWRHR